MKCRHCGYELDTPFIDLGSAPPSNAYLTAAQLRAPEKYYPLRVLVCLNCWLVQTEDYVGAEELFSEDYAYFSSYTNSWLLHAQDYVAKMIERFGLGSQSLVAEIAANDGYLLQYVQARGIPCYGVEPASGVAAAARAKGIDIVQDFFGYALASRLAGEGRRANLVVANNVLAHVPDINDFVAGIAVLLKPKGMATFEFPHLTNLVEQNQFDTIYHEHYSYLSLTAVDRIFRSNGLAVFDVEEVATHGGSLRVFARHAEDNQPPRSVAVPALLESEAAAGVTTAEYYAGFQAKADRVKNDFLVFLLDAKRADKRVAAYGAAAKGNTLLNYAGVRPDLLSHVVDRNPAKQGKYLPGSRIPIVSEDCLRSDRPDWVVILPWNLIQELVTQLAYIRDWGGRFVTAVPHLQTL
jgi:2-polyprenyl-3-methyl-5-hydroxy-6-metoxy-1,4-benzoquinol methylase